MHPQQAGVRFTCLYDEGGLSIPRVFSTHIISISKLSTTNPQWHPFRRFSFSQLLPRHPGTYFRPGYNKMAYYVNDILLRSAVAADQRLLRVFRFKDFSFPQEDEKRFNRNHRLFHRDGTHLTVWGYKRLRRAMKAAVIACVKP